MEASCDPWCSAAEGYPLLGDRRAHHGALLRTQVLSRGIIVIRSIFSTNILPITILEVDVLQSEKDGDMVRKKKILEQAAEEDFGNTEWGQWRSWLWNTIEYNTLIYYNTQYKGPFTNDVATLNNQRLLKKLTKADE